MVSVIRYSDSALVQAWGGGLSLLCPSDISTLSEETAYPDKIA